MKTGKKKKELKAAAYAAKDAWEDALAVYNKARDARRNAYAAAGVTTRMDAYVDAYYACEAARETCEAASQALEGVNAAEQALGGVNAK